MSDFRAGPAYYARHGRQRSGPFTRQLQTPEGTSLAIRIASAGERSGAFLIDFIILVITMYAGSWLFRLVFAGTGDAERIGYALFLLYIFLVRNFYFILFESGRRAATPGKRMLGTRVAMRDGTRLTANAVLARNLVREVEVFLPIYFMGGLVASGAVDGGETAAVLAVLGLAWTGVFLFFPLFNRDRLRLGDLIAGTWVVHNPKPVLDAEMAHEPAGDPFAFTPAELEAYGIHELQVLEDILRQPQSDIRAAVAARIRKKIGRTRVEGESDEAFLRGYYAALRRHLEGGLALGKAKRHKFDG
jgi:uncharacterized RDD family membrane protein YckC